MRKIMLPVVLIVASVIMIIVNIFISDEYDRGFWFRNLSSVLLIVAMVFTIISKLKESKTE